MVYFNTANHIEKDSWEDIHICGSVAARAIYSRPSQYRRSWDWLNTRGIPKTAVLGVTYNLENRYLGLENARRYWGVGGERRGGIAVLECHEL